MRDIKIYRNHSLRSFLMSILKATAFDFSMAHHWVPGIRFRLNSFRHKGYWFHGHRREMETMQLFREIIRPGDVVVEVGGHIGYISLYFAYLVGKFGKVFVFEPGSNNLPYIRMNLVERVPNEIGTRLELLERAVGDRAGEVDFYEDSLTGQNNSVVKDFDGLRANIAVSFVESEVSLNRVKMVTLDGYFADCRVDFIKIDIEGFEWFALSGAIRILERQHPAIMVEVQANYAEIYSELSRIGYLLLNPALALITQPSEMRGNTFCLHRERHADLIRQLGLC